MVSSVQPPEAKLFASEKPINPTDEQKNENIEPMYTLEPMYTPWFPPGYRFIPEDEELILHYLKNRIMNKPMPYSIIRDVELYDFNPKDLTEKLSDNGIKSWYFFTPRARKYRNGSRPSRSAGNGYWKATGADKNIFHNNEMVGAKKALVYYEGKPPDGKKTNWIMQEYRLHQPPRVKEFVGDMRLDDCVLCRVYKKEDKSVPNKRQKINEDHDTELRKKDQVKEDHVTELRKKDKELTTKNTDPQGKICKKKEFEDGNVLTNRFGNSLPSNFNNKFADDHVLMNRFGNSLPSHLINNTLIADDNVLVSGYNSAFRSKYLQQEMATMGFEDDALGIFNHDNFNLANDFFPNYFDYISGLDDVFTNNSLNQLIDPLPVNYIGESPMSDDLNSPPQETSTEDESDEDFNKVLKGNLWNYY